MKNFIILYCLLLCMIAPANARPAQCLLEVNGRSYLDNICNAELEADGSFTIGTDQKK